MDEKTNIENASEPIEKAEWKPTPIEVTHPEQVDPGCIRLLREPAWKLRLTIDGDRSYLTVKIARAAPLSLPDRYICFLDGKDEMICTVDDIQQIGEAYRPLIEEELDMRYVTARIKAILGIRSEFGAFYWDVDTDRGRRDFVAKDIGENAHWLNERRLLIMDVDGNRFAIPDVARLDKKSVRLLDLVL